MLVLEFLRARRGAALTRISTLLFVLVAATACKPTIIEDPEPPPRPPSDPAEDPLVEQEAVRVAVRSYTAAVQERDVEAASAWVVDETFAFYEDLRVAALRSTRAQLENLDLMSILMILQIRATLSRAELEAIDGRGLFGVAVSAGMVGEGVDEVSLDEVWIADDDSGVAEIRLDGQAIVWLREVDDGDRESSWRMDIPETIRRLGPAIEASAREQVVAEGRVRTAYTFLELSSDRLIPFEVIDGPLESLSTAEPWDLGGGRREDRRP